MDNLVFNDHKIGEPIITEKFEKKKKLTSSPKNMPKRKVDWRVYLKSAILLVIGSSLAAIAINVIYLPMNFTMGGVGGIGSILYYVFGDFIPFGVLFFLINLPLILIGWIKINRKFVWRCIIGIFAYSVAIDLWRPFVEVLTEKLRQPINGDRPDMLVFAIMAGLVGGAGIGIILKSGFMTGGSDIVAILLHRIWQNVSIGRIMMIIDMSIISSTLVIYSSADNKASPIMLVVYSLIALVISAKMIDVMLTGFDFMRSVYIISDKSDVIAERIMLHLERGVTAISGHGMYTGNEKKILLCVVSNRQIGQLQMLVDSIDPVAFMIFSQANEVRGQGFNRPGTW